MAMFMSFAGKQFILTVFQPFFGGKMSRGHFTFVRCFSTLCFLSLASGCGSQDIPITMDTFGVEDLSVADVFQEVGDIADVDDAGGDAARDTGHDNVWDAAPDPGGHDLGANDAEIDSTVDAASEIIEDSGVPDAGQDTNEPVETRCYGYDDCEDHEVCLFSLGQCQERSTWTGSELALYSVHPMDGAAGDRLIVDGDRFSSGGLVPGDFKVKIGTVLVSASGIARDENRAYLAISGMMQGPITVYDGSGNVATIKGPFVKAEKGVIACDDSTPAATGEIPDYPWQVGPYAAGYVDIFADWNSSKTRVFYPAECGSVRRPAVEGTWPLVVILHGNGALHLQYEYLAELLATWGYVSIMPETVQNMAGEDYSQVILNTGPVVNRFLDRNLAEEHEVLAPITTTDQILWIGHSRGTGRAEELASVSETGLWSETVGGIYLGPVDDYGRTVNGSLIVFGGGKDSQSLTATYKAAYNEHDGPKWLVEIPGGNHGSFCDSKVYGYGLGALGDKEPTISRHRQHEIVQMFAVPFAQRVFGQDEPFADYLDDPPSDGDFTIVSANQD